MPVCKHAAVRLSLWFAVSSRGIAKVRDVIEWTHWAQIDDNKNVFTNVAFGLRGISREDALKGNIVREMEQSATSILDMKMR